MQTRNEKIAAKTGVLQGILEKYNGGLWPDAEMLQTDLIAAGYLIVEL